MGPVRTAVPSNEHQHRKRPTLRGYSDSSHAREPFRSSLQRQAYAEISRRGATRPSCWISPIPRKEDPFC